MEIHPYQPEMAKPLTVLFNQAMRGVPHCYPVSVRSFSTALGGDEAAMPEFPRRADAVFVASDHGEIVGFVHGAIDRLHRDSTEDVGVLCFLWHQPGKRQAGVALLDTVEQSLRDQGMQQVYAFSAKHRYPCYYLPWAHLSDHLGHVAALLGMRGYEKCEGEVYLDWRNFEVDAADADAAGVRLTVEYPQHAGRLPGVTVQAWQGDEAVGICECSCIGDYHQAHAAQDRLFTNGLGVEDEHQGRGLGRVLLQQALFEARRLGYRHAAISTDWKNYRVALFYSNFGYKARDWTYTWSHMPA